MKVGTQVGRRLVALSALGVLLAGCGTKPAKNTAAPGVFPPSQPVPWVRFRPPIGDASATFPATPDEMGQPPVPDPTRLYSCPRKNGGAFQFGVSTVDHEVPPERAKAFLADVCAGSATRPQVKLLSQQFHQAEGVDSIEFTITTHVPDVRVRNRVTVRGRYYYVLSSVGQEDQISDPESDTFLASLRFEKRGNP